MYLLACNDKPIPSFDPDGEDVYKIWFRRIHFIEHP